MATREKPGTPGAVPNEDRSRHERSASLTIVAYCGYVIEIPEIIFGTYYLRSNICVLRMNSQFAIIRHSHLKPGLRYTRR